MQFRAPRLVLAGVGAAGAAVLLAGCAQVRVFSPSQQQVVGNVRLTTIICASQNAAPCDKVQTNSGLPGLTSLGQVLLGLRISSAADGPASFTSTDGAAVFSRSDGYAAELQRLSPAPAGEKWIGYLSNTQNYVQGSGSQEITVTPDLTLAQAAGTPFQSPLKVRPVVGVRLVNTTLTADRPVACGASLTVLNDGHICVDWPLVAQVPTSQNVNTRDLGVAAGAEVSVQAGNLATVPFTLRYSGPANAGANFALTATTTAPGGTAVPGVTSLLPATDSTNTVQVAVGVPAGAAAGTFDVTLTAKLANGQTRSATGKLRVNAAPGAAGGGGGGGGGTTTTGGGGGGTTTTGGGTLAKPRLRVLLPRGLSFRQARRAGIRVLIGSNRAVNVQVELFQVSARRPKATRRVRLKSPGPTVVVLRSSRLIPGPYRVLVRGTNFQVPIRGVLRLR